LCPSLLHPLIPPFAFSSSALTFPCPSLFSSPQPDTTWQEIDEEDLVVGDIIRYRKPGSIFAVDIVVISVETPVVCKGDESFGNFFSRISEGIVALEVEARVRGFTSGVRIWVFGPRYFFSRIFCSRS
jgi:hypothetical protein